MAGRPVGAAVRCNGRAAPGATGCHRAGVKRRIVRGRSAQLDCQGNAMTIANQVAPTATARSICRISPSQQPPTPRVPTSCQPQHAISRLGHHRKASPAMRKSNPKFRPATNLATVASKSCESRNPLLSAASARECHYEARKKCLLRFVNALRANGEVVAMTGDGGKADLGNGGRDVALVSRTLSPDRQYRASSLADYAVGDSRKASGQRGMSPVQIHHNQVGSCLLST